MQTIAQIKAGNSEGIFNQMIQNNPNFAQFVQQNKGKTAEQIAKENGIDLEQVKRFLR